MAESQKQEQLIVTQNLQNQNKIGEKITNRKTSGTEQSRTVNRWNLKSKEIK